MTRNPPETERISLALRELYRDWGYRLFKMGKFEEYDLYSKNKAFLPSENIITFTDTDGRLLALKPDVTLSIVKSLPDEPGRVDKLCYHENVYRVSKRTGSFGELGQLGLECIGALDDYCLGEVLYLAARSLQTCGEDFILEVSHLGLITALLERVQAPAAERAALLRCIGEKNLHGAAAICRTLGAGEDVQDAFKTLLLLRGSPDQILPQLQPLAAALGAAKPLDTLTRALSVFEGTPLLGRVMLNCSVVSDTGYYTGIVCKGYLSGVAGSVLSGGQYDGLLARMRRSGSGMGFAVYLDLLEHFGQSAPPNDVDLMLQYGTENPAAVRQAVAALQAKELRVLAVPRFSDAVRAERRAILENGEVRFCE